jgi:hypothetical protein
LWFIAYTQWVGDDVNDVLLSGLDNPENLEYEYRLKKDSFAVHLPLVPG